jgi:hypothetical protein
LQLKSEKLGLVEIFGEGLSGFLSGALDEVLSRALSRPGDDITAPRAEPEPSVALKIAKSLNSFASQPTPWTQPKSDI